MIIVIPFGSDQHCWCCLQGVQLTKEGVDTSGNDNSLNLTLFASGTREDLTTRVPCDWQGLTSEGRLVNLERITLQETGINRDNVSQLDANHISWYQN